MTRLRLKTVPCRLCQWASLVLLALLAALSACTSRYRTELFLIQDEQRAKVKVEKTEYFVGAVLGDRMSPEGIVPGDGNCLVLVAGRRGITVKGEARDLISFDRHDRYQIFLQLPAQPEPDTLTLDGISVVHQLGRYELATEDKVYLPTRGYLVIDSLSGDRLFGTLDGQYRNRLDETVAFQGRFKARVAD
jgi:hypothetical protein